MSPVTQTHVPSFAAAASSITGDNGGGAKDVFGNGFAAFGGGPAGARRGVASLSVALFVMSHLTAGTPRTSSGFSMNCR